MEAFAEGWRVKFEKKSLKPTLFEREWLYLQNKIMRAIPKTYPRHTQGKSRHTQDIPKTYPRQKGTYVLGIPWVGYGNPLDEAWVSPGMTD